MVNRPDDAVDPCEARGTDASALLLAEDSSGGSVVSGSQHHARQLRPGGKELASAVGWARRVEHRDEAKVLTRCYCGGLAAANYGWNLHTSRSVRKRDQGNVGRQRSPKA